MVGIESDDIVGMGYEMVLSVSVLLMRGASEEPRPSQPFR